MGTDETNDIWHAAVELARKIYYFRNEGLARVAKFLLAADGK